mmetsp:Transcript_20470/g.51892  ORF Transcript_20470/g.51892 Transcript_20470/m.51892 type:complete len:215 (+) Transcript_20470:484-1128(+)
MLRARSPRPVPSRRMRPPAASATLGCRRTRPRRSRRVGWHATHLQPLSSRRARRWWLCGPRWARRPLYCTARPGEPSSRSSRSSPWAARWHRRLGPPRWERTGRSRAASRRCRPTGLREALSRRARCAAARRPQCNGRSATPHAAPPPSRRWTAPLALHTLPPPMIASTLRRRSARAAPPPPAERELRRKQRRKSSSDPRPWLAWARSASTARR